jgi:cell shape-determining protein MreC
VLKERQEQRLEAAQMKFLRHLLGITKLDRERNQSLREKLGSAEHCSGNKTVPTRVATTCRENAQRQGTQTGTEI